MSAPEWSTFQKNINIIDRKADNKHQLLPEHNFKIVLYCINTICSYTRQIHRETPKHTKSASLLYKRMMDNNEYERKILKGIVEKEASWEKKETEE